ncbi:hypothetical protein GCM10027043_38740 [Ferruginibacter profundus]
MDTRVERLLEVFQSNGWTFIGSAEVVSDWWFTDVLHLTSKWRPVNTNLYLTLLTDPQDIKEKIVWCVSVSSVIPNDRHCSYIGQVTLNDIKKIDLNEFVQKINKIALT